MKEADEAAFHDKPATSPERRALYERLDQQHTAPLWDVLGTLITPEPRPACVPALWRYDEVRRLLMEAGRVMTAQEAERRAEGDASARYGSNLLPVEYTQIGGSAPLFTYPYARCREALARVARSRPLDPRHGVKLQYADPATGGHTMPTIGAFLHLLPPGFAGEPYRSTDATVICVVEGRGRSHIGERTFDWAQHDTLSCRHGNQSPMRHRIRPCSSASPTVQLSRRSASGERTCPPAARHPSRSDIRGRATRAQ